nr:AAA family ATPase [Fredinandcohnia sp. SECRCQ15]
MAKSKTKFSCQACGYESPKWMGKCPGCNAWNTLVEEIEQKSTRKGAFNHSNTTVKTKPSPITSIETMNEPRMYTNNKEFNRVLGGGIVQGSLVLIGGDPGIGKSTLLLQISSQLAMKNKVLYISGEESVKQTKLRADRLGVTSDQLFVHAETDLEFISQAILEIKPSFVVIDSIQTIYHSDVTSAPGSVSQVRECTAELMRIAKTNGIAIFIVGLNYKKMIKHLIPLSEMSINPYIPRDITILRFYPFIFLLIKLYNHHRIR